MPRKIGKSKERKITGDTAYNVRRRFYRKAESYLKQAESAAGATAARFRRLAKLSLDDALKTYDKSTTQTFSKPIQKLAGALGVDLDDTRRKLKAKSDEAAAKIRSEFIKEGEGSKSEKALRSRDIAVSELREEEARAILSSPIGKRVIGGTESIWREAATVETDEGLKIDKNKILPALYEHFNVDNLADLLDKIENIVKEKLYSEDPTDINYETVKLMITSAVKSGNAVTA